MSDKIQLNIEGNETKNWLVKNGKILAVVLVALFLMYWSLRILAPFVLIIAIGFVIYRMLFPFQKQLNRFKFLRKSPKMKASIMTGGILTIALLPTVIILFFSIANMIAFCHSSFEWLQNDGLQALNKSANTPTFIKDYVLYYLIEYWDGLQLDIILENAKESNLLQSIGGGIITIASSVFWMILSLTLLIVIIFYLFYDGERLLNNLFYLIPMDKEDKQKYLMKFDEIVRGVIAGGILTSLVQIIFAAIGLFICGVPIFWAVIIGLATIIPVFGAAIIYVPISIHLIINGKTAYGILFFGYCVFFISSLDNFIRPLLINAMTNNKQHVEKKPDSINLYVSLLFSIIGGLMLFGAAGIIFGPIVFGLMKISIENYKKEFKNLLDQKNTHE